MLQVPHEQDQGRFIADARNRHGWIGLITLTVVVGLAYFFLARLSIQMLAKVGAVIFWPAAGISTGTLVALGRDARWPVAVAISTATIAANLAGGRAAWISIMFALCTAGEALLIAWLIEHRFGRHFSLGKLRHVLGFVAAAIVGGVVAASGAALVKLIADPNQSIWINWWNWFSGDLIGLFAVAPFVIWLAANVRAPPPRSELIEGTAAVAVIGSAAGVAIALLPETWWEMCLLVAILFPMLLWPASRCRPVFASTAALAVCGIVVYALSFDIGNFNTASMPIGDLALNAHLTIVGVAFLALILASLFEERAESARRLQEALSAGSVVAFDHNVDTDVTQRSDNAARILGFDEKQPFTAASFRAHVHPEDRASYLALLGGLRPDKPSYSTIYRFVRPDSREIWLQDTAKGDFDTTGRLMRLSGLRIDITARKQAENHQKILIGELDHRVKNALARVAAIVTATRETSRSMDDFANALDGRLQSMAAAHALLSKGSWRGVGVADLIRDQLAPYTTGANVTTRGPNTVLNTESTQALAMVVHELATNAAKYGALSTPRGRLFIGWREPSGGQGAAGLTVEWRERGGPLVTKPTRMGFGTSLIEQLISHELGGTVHLAFDPDGVRCRMSLPRGHA